MLLLTKLILYAVHQVAPPGLELTEDLNPGYDISLHPPYTVPMRAVKEGGRALEIALKSWEQLEDPLCSDLWAGRSRCVKV
jgi:hypothetical protein